MLPLKTHHYWEKAERLIYQYLYIDIYTYIKLIQINFLPQKCLDCFICDAKWQEAMVWKTNCAQSFAIYSSCSLSASDDMVLRLHWSQCRLSLCQALGIPLLCIILSHPPSPLHTLGGGGWSVLALSSIQSPRFSPQQAPLKAFCLTLQPRQ